MTLPASGQISLFDISDEFNPANTAHSNVKLGDFYAGGAYVPSGCRNGSGVLIPSSGQISVFDFYGAANTSYPIDGVGCGVSQSNFPTGSTNCHVNFNSDGTISHGGGGGSTTNHYTGPSAWATGTAVGSNYGDDYEFIVDSISNVIGAGPSTPTVGVWSPFTATLSCSAGPGSSSTGDCNCRIRNATTHTVVASFVVSLECDNT